ncbi:transcriptional regulator [Allorhizobium taibaishanense]|uniref:transcriptional regulator n=1 Tax=Allorhizobium taibaishanense TaxID=887144 RepID=UPI00094F9D23|nr:YdaS family helix-turn-helix protein [Allorhizobium taibaishanense]
MEEVCRRAIAAGGGPTLLAQSLGDISPQAVSQWRRVPATRVLLVEKMTRISRHELRPDIYGPLPELGAMIEGKSPPYACGPP